MKTWKAVGAATAEASMSRSSDISARAARDRTLKQLQYFIAEDRKNLKRFAIFVTMERI